MEPVHLATIRVDWIDADYPDSPVDRGWAEFASRNPEARPDAALVRRFMETTRQTGPRVAVRGALDEWPSLTDYAEATSGVDLGALADLDPDHATGSRRIAEAAERTVDGRRLHHLARMPAIRGTYVEIRLPDGCLPIDVVTAPGPLSIWPTPRVLWHATDDADQIIHLLLPGVVQMAERRAAGRLVAIASLLRRDVAFGTMTGTMSRPQRDLELHMEDCRRRWRLGPPTDDDGNPVDRESPAIVARDYVEVMRMRGWTTVPNVAEAEAAVTRFMGTADKDDMDILRATAHAAIEVEPPITRGLAH